MKKRKIWQLTLVEVAELAEVSRLDEVLDAMGVPPLPPFPRAREEMWDEGKKFDAANFNEAARKKYMNDFFKK